MVAYGALLRDGLLAVPEHGWVNLHFSLLPAWRGAAPVQAAIAAGDTVTGATTFQIEPALDSGPVYGVVTETIRPTDTAGDLLDRLSISGAALLETTLDGIADGSLTPVPQPADGVTVAPKVTVERGPGALGPARPCRRPADPRGHAQPRRVDHDRRPAGQARAGHRRRRGAEPAAAGGDSGRPRRRPGRDRRRNRCCSGSVQPPGKKPMDAADWARGARLDDDPPGVMTKAPQAAPQAARPGASRRVRRAAGGLGARRLRQPGAARAAARARHHRPRRRLRHRTDLRQRAAPADCSTPSSPQPRDARRTSIDPVLLDLLRLGTYQLLRTRRRRSTPRCPPPSSRPASNSIRRERVSSTACCAPSPGATSSPGSAELAPSAEHRPGRAPGVRARPSALDRPGVRRRARRRRRRARCRCWPPTTTGPLVHLAARPGVLTADAARRTRWTAPSAATRRTRCTWPAATRAGWTPVRDGAGAGSGRGQPAGGPGADAGAAGRRRRRPLAGSVRGPRRQDRAAGRDRPRSRGARVTAIEPNAAPRRARRGEHPRTARRGAAGRRPRLRRCEPGVRPGAGRRAVHRARRAAAPTRGALAPAARPTCPRWRKLQRELLAVGDRADPARRRGAVRDLLTAPGRDRRRGRRRAAPPSGDRAGHPAAVRRASTISATGRTCSCGRTGTAPTRCSRPPCKVG